MEVFVSFRPVEQAYFVMDLLLIIAEQVAEVDRRPCPNTLRNYLISDAAHSGEYSKSGLLRQIPG